MRRKYYIKSWKRFIAIYLAFLMGIIALNAQISRNTYYTVGWQFDFPINSSFSSTMNDLGIYAEAGYYFTPNISLGGFINVNTQYEEVMSNDLNILMLDNIRETLSYISVPVGVSVRYRFIDESWLQPYLSAKVGINYAEAKSTFPMDTYSDKSCGFYVSPELGINIFPFKRYILGLNVAAYYAYATNRHEVSERKVNGIESMGIRLGLTF